MPNSHALIITEYGDDSAVAASLEGCPGFRVYDDSVDGVFDHLPEALKEFGIDEEDVDPGYREVVCDVEDLTVSVRAVMGVEIERRLNNVQYVVTLAEHDPRFIANATPDDLDEIAVIVAFPSDSFAELAAAMPMDRYAVVATKFTADGPLFSINAARGSVPSPTTSSREIASSETVGDVFVRLGALDRAQSSAKVLVHA